MGIKINTVLELYDLYTTLNIKNFFSKFIENVNTSFVPSNPEIGFRFAQEKFGTQKIFPCIFVFRDLPPSPADEDYSAMNFNITFSEGLYEYNNVNVYLDYVVTFYSKKFYDMNLFSIGYYKFRSYRVIEYNFSDVGLMNCNFRAEAMIGDISSNNSIDSMFEKDLYFSYSFEFSVFVPLFIFKKGIEVENIVLSLYDEDVLLKEVIGG